MTQRFQFPNLCARCGAEGPTTVWTLQDTRSVHGPAATVHTFRSLNLHVCPSCRQRMRTGVLCTLPVSGLIGVCAFFPIQAWLAPQELPVPWLDVGIAAFVGLIVLTGCFFVLKPFTAPEFAKLSPDGRVVRFNNPEYQREFEALNQPVVR
jgi:hypothetical protein